MDKQTIRVMWFVPPLLAMVAAQDRRSLVTQSIRNRSSDEQFNALVAGEVDAVVTSMDNGIGWNRRVGPQDFRVVAQVERTTPLILVARAGRSNMSALRGADILVDAPDNGFVTALRAMLDDAGIGRDEYRLVPAGGVQERLEALLARQGVATLLGHPFDAMAVKAGFVRNASVQEHYPDFPGQGIVMRTGSRARSLVGAWLEDLERARQVVQERPALARQVVVSAGLPVAAADGMIALNPQSLRPTSEGVALLIAHRRALGLAGADSDYPAIVDDSLVHEHIGEKA
ncbi:ABC transporter substrate-binding protein [Paraburkholderia sp. BL17N1]|uniref:ABC transporter substrate-binding protein n=1 Tax=Paraburkholderia sp. BL17N1 TaxID=1938798 RepID=UPI000EB41B2A|nr:ABC transporter substrate-binding protein [Paraburkholderia sp. BL17N1]RKR31355.1 ABC-type nitrate/sulfonate/bicarbonate transport system substrate-binding protein [Paraburkholderia sp. BL17N1]